MPFIKPGYRTYLLSFLTLAVALVLQGHAQGLYTLDSEVRITLMYVLTIVMPLVPVYLRKAISDQNAANRHNRRR